MSASNQTGDALIERLEALHAPWRARLPDEVARKYRKMAEDPYGYFRGTAPLFHEAVQAQRSTFAREPSRWLLLNGDVHLQNYGTRRDAAGVAVFDLADFDEAGHGPVVHDLWRLATSFVLAARPRTLDDEAIDRALGLLARHYSDALSRFAADDAGPARFRLTAADTEGHVRKRINKLGRKSRAELLATVGAGDKWANVPRARWPAFEAALTAYRDSLPVEAEARLARRDVLLSVHERRGAGNGSLGRHRYHLRIEAGEAGELILELKEQAASALRLPVTSDAPRPLPAHHGHRVAAAIRRLQSHPDPRTGWTTLDGLPFLVREKSPFESDLDCDKLDSAEDWLRLARYTAQLLARTHALGAARERVEAVAADLAADGSGFAAEVREVAHAQAARVEAEHRLFRRWHEAQDQ